MINGFKLQLASFLFYKLCRGTQDREMIVVVLIVVDFVKKNSNLSDKRKINLIFRNLCVKQHVLVMAMMYSLQIVKKKFLGVGDSSVPN